MEVWQKQYVVGIFSQMYSNYYVNSLLCIHSINTAIFLHLVMQCNNFLHNFCKLLRCVWTWSVSVMKKSMHFRNTTTTNKNNITVGFLWVEWKLIVLLKTELLVWKPASVFGFNSAAACCISCAPCSNSPSQSLHGAHFKPLTPSLSSCSPVSDFLSSHFFLLFLSSPLHCSFSLLSHQFLFWSAVVHYIFYWVVTL